MKDKMKALLNKPVVLLVAAAVLLLASTVSGTQAAITYYSEDYKTSVDVPNIDVALLENGNQIGASSLDAEDGENTTVSVDAILFDGQDKNITLGKSYDEELTVKNTGEIDSYVRVVIKKYWTYEEEVDGKKVTVKDRTLSPKYIDLNLVNKDGEGAKWIAYPNIDEHKEQIVLYYAEPVAKDGTTVPFADSFRIDNAFETTVHEEKTSTTGEDGTVYTTITYSHPFDNYNFNVEVEVDAVQTYDAKEAIKSAWGVNVTLTDGVITAIN